MVQTIDSGRSIPVRCAVALGMAALLSVPVAVAGLGDPVASVARDHAQLRGTALVVTPLQAYDRHEITTDDGTRVREYVSRAGTVFGVTFAGPSLPDLKVVLAGHYDEYTAAAAAARPGSHHVLAINTPGLVVTVIKRPRGFSGSAHVPALLPAGTTAGDLH